MMKRTPVRLMSALAVAILVVIAAGCGVDTYLGKEAYVDDSSLSSDTSPPYIKSTSALSEKTISLRFSEAVTEASALETANYIISSSEAPLGIESVNLNSADAVIITLSNAMEYGTDYQCYVANVADLKGNKMSGSSRSFSGRSPVLALLTGTPASVTSSTDLQVTVTGEDVTAYRYRIDEGEWSSSVDAGTAIAAGGIGEGTHRLEVIGSDSLGNWQNETAPTRFSWTVDTTPPMALFENLPANITAEKSISVTVGDAFAYRYRLNDEDWSEERQGPIVREDFRDGTYTLTAVARDLAGNWQDESSATTYTWKIDTSVPVAALSGVPDAVTADRNAVIYVTGTGLTAYRYSFDGGAWSGEIPLATPVSRTGLGEGDHGISVIAKNEAGTWQEVTSPTTGTWKIDLTPPATVTLPVLPDNPSGEASPEIRVGGSDVAWYRYRLDGGGWSGTISAMDKLPLSSLSEGSHTISVIGMDSVGNEAAPISHTWTVDLTAPAALFAEGTLPPLISNNREQAFTVTGSGVTVYRYRLDSDPWSENIYISSNVISPGADRLTEGEHTIKIIGGDAAGNWQSTDEATSYTWTIDVTPPAEELVLSNLPASPTSSDAAAITVSGADSTGYQYRLDSGQWQTVAGIETVLALAGLGEGSHLIEVRGIDAAGNAQETPVQYTWKVDRTAADAVLAGLPPALTNQTLLNITVGGSDVAAYRYNLDDGGWSGETDAGETISAMGLDAGPHSIAVVARDAAGNWQTTDNATTFAWTIDVTAPTALVTGYPSSPVNDGAVDIDVAGDDVYAYRYRFNSGAWSGEISSAVNIVRTLNEGSYVLDVIGRDSAGNWQSAPTTASFVIDKTPPALMVASDAGDWSQASSLVFSWGKGDDVTDVKIQVATDETFKNIVLGGSEGASIGSVEGYTFPASASAGSRYYARVRGVDNAGNWSAFGTASDGIILAGSVSIRVKNNTGQDIPGATAALKKAVSGTVLQTLSTGADGTVTFNNVEVGENAYAMEITASGYSSAVKNSISVNLGSVSDQGTITLVSTSASSGKFTGTVIDANDGSAITGAAVEVRNYAGTTVATVSSDGNGSFVTGTLPPGTYSLNVSKNNYYDLLVDNKAVDGNRQLGRQALSEVLAPYRLKVTLLWGGNPRDLDLHVVGPSESASGGRFHVSWHSKSYTEPTGSYSSSADPVGSFATTSLVQDSTRGYGPETINLFKLDDNSKYSDGVFTFTVHKYSWSGSWYDEPITLRIYDSMGMWQEIPFPSGADDSLRYWKVFQVDMQGVSRSERTLTVVNEFATLNHSSLESMDWQVAPGGMAGYLMAVARGDTPAILSLLGILALLILGIWLFNRRRAAKGA